MTMTDSHAAHASLSHSNRPQGPPVIAGVPPDRRRAIVVGASSGIGAALVKQLAREGYSVAAVARRMSELENLAQSCAADSAATGGRVIVRAHDVNRADEV